MKLIAFIQEQPIIKKILNHLGLLNKHDPPVLKLPSKSYNHNSGYNDYILSVDDYIRDPDPEIFYPDPVYDDFNCII